MLTKAFKSVKALHPVAARSMATSSDKPKRVVVTGAAGQISYSILFRIARY
jgi:hypothetical protein